MWRRILFGKEAMPPEPPQPASEPQHLGSSDEVFLAKLVADLADGKRRGEITVAKNAQNTDVEAAALADDGVKRALEGKAPRKVIVVPNRIVNIVA